MREKTICCLFLLFFITKTTAQSFQEMPIDLLDKPSSIYYSFHRGETYDQKSGTAKWLTNALLGEGFNLVKEEEKEKKPNEAYQLRYAKDNDSLEISFEITFVTGSNYVLIITDLKSAKSIEFSGPSFATCTSPFHDALIEYKKKNPTANQVPFQPTALNIAKNRKVSNHRIDEAGYPTIISEPPYNFINEIPSDLASSTLVVLLYDELPIDPDDAVKLTSAELEKRTARTTRLKSKNAKYKEQFTEYPYPVVFALPQDIDSLCEQHRYLLVDVYDNKLVSKDRFSNGRPTHSSMSRTFHTFSFRDNKKPDTYYSLDDWANCEKGGDVFCFNRFIKGILREQKK